MRIHLRSFIFLDVKMVSTILFSEIYFKEINENHSNNL